MGRMRKGEEGHDRAVASWRKTMEGKYGGQEGLHKFVQSIGAKGGKLSTEGGFKSNPELARKVGAIGGRKSVRSKSKTNEILAKSADITKMYDAGMAMTEIAKAVDIPYCSVRYWIKKNIK